MRFEGILVLVVCTLHALADPKASAEADPETLANPSAEPIASPKAGYDRHYSQLYGHSSGPTLPPYYTKPIYNPHYVPPVTVQPQVQSTTPRLQVFQSEALPKQNCTVEDEAIRAEICIPDFQTKCTEDGIVSRRLEEGEFCYDVTRTVCTLNDITTSIQVCSYSYERQEETAKAKTVDVEFKQECETQMVTVCQPRKGENIDRYGRLPQKNQPKRPQAVLQECQEVAQETCYNIPQVIEKEVEVSMGFPQAKRECRNESVTIPEIKCEDIVETKCQNIPRIVEGPDPVESCEVIVGEPKCSEVELVLPKQVCRDIVYGFTPDENAQTQPQQPRYAPPPLPNYHTPRPFGGFRSRQTTINDRDINKPNLASNIGQSLDKDQRTGSPQRYASSYQKIKKV